MIPSQEIILANIDDFHLRKGLRGCKKTIHVNGVRSVLWYYNILTTSLSMLLDDARRRRANRGSFINPDGSESRMITRLMDRSAVYKLAPVRR